MEIFREYDIRGTYPDQINEKLVRMIGAIIGKMSERYLIGRDGRLSSPVLYDALKEGLILGGAEVISLNIVPTHVVAFLAKELEAGGVMVTASHNPSQYNGLKIFTPEGEILSKKEREVIKKKILMKKSLIAEKGELKEKYKQSILEKFPKKLDLRCVIDSGNGVGNEIIKEILEKKGMKVFPINSRIDGNFPSRESEPRKDNVKVLCDAVSIYGADFGVAFDGDADRALIVDEKGNVIDPNKIICILANLTTKNKEKIVVSADTSMIIDEYLGRREIKTMRSKVGTANVVKTMKNVGAKFGGEFSGHWFFSDHLNYSDPFWFVCLLAEKIEKRRLSEIAKEIREPNIVYSKIFCNNKDIIIEKLKENLSNMIVNTIDGVRFFDDGCYVLVRASNTEPMIRIAVEGENADRVLFKFEDLIRKHF